MFFEVSSNLIASSNHLQLSTILSHAINGLLNVKLGEEGDEIVSGWFDSLDVSERGKWRDAYRHAVKMEARYKFRNRVIVNKLDNSSVPTDWEKNPPEITLSDAIDLAGQHKRIVLENSRADRKFLLSLLDDDIRSRILSLEKSGRLVFHNGGGIGELKMQLEQTHLPLSGSRFFCLVMLDSDSAAPGQISPEATGVVELCNQYRVPVHCLQRRAIENYLPKSAIMDAIKTGLIDEDISSKVEDFFKLNATQRHHYHLKRGLQHHNCKGSGLYANDEVKSFKNGFGDKFSKVFEMPEGDLPKLHKSMLEDGAHEEVKSFIFQLQMMIRGLQ